MVAGALMLWLLARSRSKRRAGAGSWASAFMLSVYAAGFSFAYVKLSAATGALLLFGAVQVTMITYGIWRGERLNNLQFIGLVLAFGGIVDLLPWIFVSSTAGCCIDVDCRGCLGEDSLRGKGMGDPIWVTASNFFRTVPFAAILSFMMLDSSSLDNIGFWYAVTSGAQPLELVM